ncbi:MAG: hypothetical protein C5B59_20390 [Bacteroidetes bacterium]|nr:MAG: hypothetical protein C5B59_20390 [Bacteroidota bacterium]
MMICSILLRKQIKYNLFCGLPEAPDVRFAYFIAFCILWQELPIISRPKTKPMKIFFSICILFLIACASKAQPKATNDTSQIVTIHADSSKMEIESEFPGGPTAWARFLNANLVYPKKAVKKNIEGDVIVQFIVDKEGNVSNVEALSGPELLREAAVKVFQNSPKWKPAFQYGRKVKSYKKQPIKFRLQTA